ncbi:aldo/keto reductase [Naasia lichenicola]|uniref:Aldo/keto reductase n=2 Tax=Naasia lichenicola TaxID=2565933 RepID=A0A4S4FQ28_9MICO|nr:aldo/keto reductase [Naasia lichenicola]
MRRLGDSELAVFPLILGASTFGWTAGADASMAILDAYLEAGGNAIDTADSYSAGRSETVIGTWLRDRGARDRMVLSTKIAQSSENPGLSAQSIARSVDASLQRLGVDYLDLLYFHLDDRAVPLEESLTAADALVRSGKVRYLAASGFDGDRLMQARILAGQLDLPRFVAVQVPYNLLQREEFEQRLFPVVRAQQLAAVPFSSLASGFLTGKYRGRVKGERGSEAHSRATRAAQFASKRGFRVLDALEDVAEEHDRSLAAVALAWLLTKPLVTAPVVSVSRPEQLADLLTATRLNLTRHQVALLDRVSAG